MSKIFNFPQDRYDIVVIGDPLSLSDPSLSSAFTVNVTDKGILLPRLTDSQMRAIVNPANGLLVYNVTHAAFYYRKLNTWVEIGGSDNGGGSGSNTNVEVQTNTIPGELATLDLLDLSAYKSAKWMLLAEAEDDRIYQCEISSILSRGNPLYCKYAVLGDKMNFLIDLQVQDGSLQLVATNQEQVNIMFTVLRLPISR